MYACPGGVGAVCREVVWAKKPCVLRRKNVQFGESEGAVVRLAVVVVAVAAVVGGGGGGGGGGVCGGGVVRG